MMRNDKQKESSQRTSKERYGKNQIKNGLNYRHKKLEAIKCQKKKERKN